MQRSESGCQAGVQTILFLLTCLHSSHCDACLPHTLIHWLPHTHTVTHMHTQQQVSPHILIHWRPDDSTYRAFLTRKAPVGAKVEANPAINMAVLPNTKGGA